MSQNKLPFPLMLVAIDGFGCLLLLLGVLGLTGKLDALPALSIPLVAWTLTIVGGLTAAAALGLIIFNLLNAARASADSRR